MKQIGKNVLVIQQNADCLDVLDSAGCKVIVAEDCLDGARKIIRHRPDLVITKAETPNLNAINMARILEMLKVHTPILLTGQKNLYEKAIEESPNLWGFLLDSAIYFDLKNYLLGNDKIFIKRSIDNQKYRFNEHEWSNLISRRGPKRILLVEFDNLTRIATLIKLDTHTDHQLYVATNGKDAILKALLVKPDLIVTSVDLPEINGLAMSQIFYILNKPFPILFLTANDDPALKERLLKVEGVIGLLYKGQVSRRGALVEAIEKFLLKAEEMKEDLDKRYMMAAPQSSMDEDLFF